MWTALFHIAMHHRFWDIFLLWLLIFLLVAIPGWLHVSAYTKEEPEKFGECGHCTWGAFSFFIAFIGLVVVWHTFDFNYLPWNDTPMWQSACVAR